MLIKKKTPIKFFWMVLFAFFLLTGGQILADSTGLNDADLIINEFVAANGRGLVDEDGDYSDWIEIYNRGPQPINLAGWSLTNDPDQPTKWPFPDITLGGHDYLVVFASGKNRRALEPGTTLHTNFKLNKDGDFLALHNVLEGRFMDLISPRFPRQFRDVSYGRYGAEQAFGYLSIPTPGEPNEETLVQAGAVSPVEFSLKRGFYEAPFTVELTTTTPDATIRYTTDGGEPTELNGTAYTGPITVESTMLLRAAAFKPDFLPSAVGTQTYIFLDEVLTRFGDGVGLATNWPRKGPMTFLTEKDEGIGSALINNSTPQAELKASLTSIPTLSLVLDRQSLADLYTHPQARDKDSERPVSVELIDPDGAKPGFQINAGIRLYGLPAYAASSPKHSFQLFFRGKYGATKLEYPLFSDSPIEAFDTLLLLAGEDGPSVEGSSVQAQPAYTRNEWLRASQVAMSGLGSHGRFVQLYLNGRYWGLYNIVEKPDAALMASYLGGEKEDWFVATQEGPLTTDLGRPADELNYLFMTLALAPSLQAELVQPEHLADIYAAVASALDPAQVIDFVILNWYAETQDWPEPNWYAAIRLENSPDRGKLLIGDSQASYHHSEAAGFGKTDNARRNTIKVLFETLIQNPDFKVQFADRLYHHLFNNGTLGDANAQARWLRLNQTIGQATIAEAARWGNTSAQPPLTYDDWRQAVDTKAAKMEGNAARLVSRAREAGYYPDFDPPLFSQNGGLVEAGFTLTMALADNTCKDCTIYYTTNGSDPRLPVTGEVMPGAMAYDAPLVLTTSTHLKARVWSKAAAPDSNQTWSALHEATFSVVEQDKKLRLTEIMYNPAGGDDYEFIELQNRGHSQLDLANMFIDEGVRFTFPPNGPPLSPGAYLVLVSNPKAFAERYPDVAISGVYDGHLSNKGEKIMLRDAMGKTLVEVEYDDGNGWPISPDGRGDSLNLVDEAADPNDPRNWRASTHLYGSPGAAEPIVEANSHES